MTIKSRYPGKCRDCGTSFPAGTEIEWHGRRRGSSCLDCAGSGKGGTRINTFRTSGGTFYRNARGRCEDAPCCGCCTI
jgi:hypothetical protein